MYLPMKKKTEIYLIRHAESLANTGILFENEKDNHLSEKGKKQAKALARKLTKPDKVFVSTYIRTHQTAKPTLEKFKKLEHEVLDYIHELARIHPDNYRDEKGVLQVELYGAYADKLKKMMDPHHRSHPERETFAEFIDRVVKFTHWANEQEGKVYVFSHAFFIKMFLFISKEQKDLRRINYKKLMKGFFEIREHSSYKVKNTQVVNVTKHIKKFKKKGN